MKLKPRTKQIYDRAAGNYDYILKPLERYFLSDWRAEASAHLPKNARMLEVGAGTGLNFRHYPAPSMAVASEISGAMLEIARGRSGSAELVRADAENLPFETDAFDAALATLVFCSLNAPEKAFQELQRVVRSGGKIVLLEHVRPEGVKGYLFDALSVLTVAVFEDHFNRRTAKLAADSGLKILEVRRKAFGAVNLIVCEVVK